MSIITESELDRIIAEHDRLSGAFKHAMGGDNCWDAGIEIVRQCGNLFDSKYTIVFSTLVDEKIKMLMKIFKNLEWLGYLVGSIDHNKSNVYIEDMIIPKQKVSTGAVVDVEYEWNEGLPIIGVIHSHHTMGAFFSGTDDAYINQNHDVSIVVASRPGNEIKGQVRMKTQCDKFYVTENVTFHVNNPLVLDVGAFMEIIRSNIKAPIYTAPTYTNPTYIRPSHFTRVIGGIGANIAERIGFKPFNSDDLEFEKDEEDEDDLDSLLTEEDMDDVEFEEVDYDDVNQSKTWADLVEDQKELVDRGSVPLPKPPTTVKPYDINDDDQWRGIDLPKKQVFTPFSVNQTGEDYIRKERLGWLTQ